MGGSRVASGLSRTEKLGNMGILGMLEFHKALARLVEIYVPPVERDYWAY